MATQKHEPVVSDVIKYESGELGANETIALFGRLMRSGLAWRLQGSYGRTACHLINNGYIDRSGKVLRWEDEPDDSGIHGEEEHD